MERPENPDRMDSPGRPASLAGTSQRKEGIAMHSTQRPFTGPLARRAALAVGLLTLVGPARAEERPVATRAYFGAVHVHTGFSFDAFTNGTLSAPSDAYEWARGKAIPGGGGGPDLKILRPLDFYAVSDHAEYMGVFRLMADPESPLGKSDLARRVTSKEPGVAMQAFAEVLREMSAGHSRPELTDPKVSRPIWKQIVETADRYYEPGEFTTFPAFEWTSNPNKRNLHRVVVFASSKSVPELPLSSLDSDDPEALWRWMEGTRAKGATLLAIPHNANASDGLMFSLETRTGKPLTKEYVQTRAANEPLYEVSQIKGTSETHPDLSPNDEFAGFEQWDYTLSADSERPTRRKGSFARQAYLDGLSLAGKGLGNPFRFGLVGDTDTHNAAASHEEDNYTGKFAMENDPRHRLDGTTVGTTPGQARQVREFSSGGLAAVWAEENTRESIFAAMQRKETFGTSGPHLQVRFFGGWDFDASDVGGGDVASVGYRKGVPMGATLAARGEAKAPSFLIAASKDPSSGNLDRVQVIKGWVDREGRQHEKIYDVAWSGDRKPDAATGKLPAVGNTVDVKQATYTNDIGSAQLAVAWSDPAFDPAEQAFYYARVLEIPTPRWSTRDAAKLGVEIPEGLPATIQERAWSSPIWYAP
jgi:hypothetical protein